MEETKKNIPNIISAKEIIEKIAKITEFQQTTVRHLIDGVDYGMTDSRSNKASLMKSGAEKVLQIIGAKAKFKIINKYIDHEKGYFFYEFACKVVKDGEVISIGYGSANTQENKYKKTKSVFCCEYCIKNSKKTCFC